MRICAEMADRGTKPDQPPSALRGGIFPGVPTIDLAEAIRRHLAESGLSQYRAALNGGLPQDAICWVLSVHVPRLSRVEQIWGAPSVWSSTSVHRGTFRSTPTARKRPVP